MPGEDPPVFAVELETLAMRAFGDLSSLARLQLVRDRFIARQMECSLRRHLDSVSWALLFGILWTDAVCGRAMLRTQTVGEPTPFRIGVSRPIGLTMWGRKVARFVIRKIMTC